MTSKRVDMGIVYPMIYPDQKLEMIEETIAKILNDDYFNVIEIGRMPEEIKKKVKKNLKNSKINVVYSGNGTLLSQKLNLNALEEEVRLKSVAALKDEIDEALEAGARLFTLLSGRYQQDKIEEHMSALEKSLIELSEYAEAKGELKIALEIFDADIDKKSLIGPTYRAKKLMERVKRKNIGLLVDLSHIPMLGETLEESIEPIKDYIIHLHIGNTILDPESCLYGDSHPRFGHPHGVNDVKELEAFLRKITSIDYFNSLENPMLSFEVKPYDGESSEIVIAGSKRALREAWRNIENKKESAGR